MSGEGAGGVCFSVFLSSSLFVFLLAKKLYVLKLQRRKFICFNGEKRKKLVMVSLFLCFGLPRRKFCVEGEEERNWRCCILMKKRSKFCFWVL